MRHYVEALKRFTDTHLGDTEIVVAAGRGAAAATATDVRSTDEELRSDLNKISTGNANMIHLCAFMLVLLFVAAFIIVIIYLNHPDVIKTIFAVVGLSFTGLIKQMLALWREKVHSDMVLVLARKLNTEDLRALINILLEK